MKKTIKSRLNNFSEANASNTFLFKGAGGGFIVKALGSVLGFILHILLTRILGADQYGIYMYVLTWLNFISIIGTLGFSTASTRFFSEYISQDKWDLFYAYKKFSRTVVWALSVVSTAGIVIISFLFVNRGEDPVLFYTFLIGGLSVPLLNLVNIHSAELKGLRRVVVSLIPKNILKQGSMIVLLLITLHIFSTDVINASSIIIIDLAALLICFLYVRFYLHKELPVGNEKSTSLTFKRKYWVNTSKDMLLIAGFNLLLIQGDQLLLGILKGTYEVGIYAVLSKISLVVIFILTAVNSALSPMIADLYASRKLEQLQRVVSNGANIIFVVSLLVIIILIIFDETILKIFGQEFIVGKKAFRILLFAQLVNAFAGPAIMILNMTGFQNYSAKILAFGTVTNLVLNFILIPIYGIIGAAISTCISMIIWNSLAFYFAKIKVGIHSSISISTSYEKTNS